MDFSKIQELEAEDLMHYLKDNIFFFAASLVFLLAIYLRYMPAQGMKYLQALDPYVIFRYSQHLALDGKLPVTDFMRYFPYNQPIYRMNMGDIFIPAVMYWLGPFLFFDYLSWGQFYPALMGAIGVFITYFLGKEIFDRTTGLSAAFFLAVIPGVMHRSSAGFFEKEPTGTVFMLFSMLFFVKAWKNENWKYGIVSGVSLALFSMSWGGSKMLWFLYPVVVGLMLWINEDIRGLVTAFTPTVILGAGIASVINPFRTWFTQTPIFLSFGMLAFLWSRHLVEQLEIVDQEKLKYYTPSMSLAGLIALVLSPLYSDFLASKFEGIIITATRSGGGDVVGGTVAENTPASLGQLAGQLGALSSSRIAGQLPGFLPSRAISSALGIISNLNGPWTLAFVGIVFLGATIASMIFRKTGLFPDEIEDLTFYKLALIVMIGWALTFSVLFQDSIALVVGPPVLVIIGAMVSVYGLDELENRKIEYRWYYILPLIWAISNILAAVTQSRLIFLSAFPAAFMAGFGFSLAIKKIREMGDETVFYLSAGSGVLLLDLVILTALSSMVNLMLSIAVIAALNGLLILTTDEEHIEKLRTSLEDRWWKVALLTLFIGLTVVVNFSAGFVNAQSLGGSPNQLWMDNLEYMEQNTDRGDVIMSWWDYGYWFQSIGRRAAVADGGNSGFYTGGEKINFPLADFLTSSSPENHTDFLKKHSVDYIVLDETMIGKYSAVSQIHNRDNSQFKSMRQLTSTGGNLRNSLSQSGNQTVASFSSGSLRAHVPIEIKQNPVEVKISGPPTGDSPLGRGKIDCMLTEDGKKSFNVSETAQFPARWFGSSYSRGETLEVCIAQNPFNSLRRAALTGGSAKMVIVPKDMQDAALVKLYLQDGHGIDFVEKVPDGSNGFVKMWKVNLEE